MLQPRSSDTARGQGRGSGRPVALTIVVADMSHTPLLMDSGLWLSTMPISLAHRFR